MRRRRSSSIVETDLMLTLATLLVTRVILLAGGIEEATPRLEWPIFRGDPSHTGIAPGSLPAELELRWTFDATAPIASSPVVSEGKVVFGADNGNVYAVSLEKGELIWTFLTADIVEAPPLIHDRRVFVGSSDGFFYALDLDEGLLLWKHETHDRILGSANWFPGPEGEADRIVVGSYDSALYCFNSVTGELAWTYETGDRLNGAPAVVDGHVIVGGCDTILHVVSGATGESVRELPMGESCYIAATVGISRGRGYFGHYGNAFVCVDLDDGTVIWSFDHPSLAFFSPPAIGEKRVYFGGRDKRLHCVDRETGEELWSHATRRNVDSGPVLCGDKVIFASGDGRLRLLDATEGTELWSYDIGKPILGSPAVVAGMVVTGAGDGRLYAFAAPSL